MILLDTFALQQATCRGRMLAATDGLRSEDSELLRQELLLDVIRRAPKFDAARGDWQGFVRGVMHNHASVLVIRRRRRSPEVLGDDLINQEQVSDAESLDILDRRRPNMGETDAMHLRLDVRRAVESLPPTLRVLALLLAQLSVKEVCEYTGRSRSRVYQLIRQIREVFIAAGLAPDRWPRQGSDSSPNNPDSYHAKGLNHEDHK